MWLIVPVQFLATAVFPNNLPIIFGPPSIIHCVHVRSGRIWWNASCWVGSCKHSSSSAGPQQTAAGFSARAWVRSGSPATSATTFDESVSEAANTPRHCRVGAVDAVLRLAGWSHGTVGQGVSSGLFIVGFFWLNWSTHICIAPPTWHGRQHLTLYNMLKMEEQNKLWQKLNESLWDGEKC